LNKSEKTTVYTSSNKSVSCNDTPIHGNVMCTDTVLKTEYHNEKTHTCVAAEALFSKSLR